MKSLILALGFLASLNAVAAAPSDSWDAIRADRAVARISQGAYANAFGSDGFFNACVDGNNLKSIRGLAVCAEGKVIRDGGGQEGAGDSFVCTREEVKNVVLPIAQVEKRCLVSRSSGGGQESETAGETTCIKWEEVAYNIPTTQNFGVYKSVRGGGQESGFDTEELLFNKAFVIPACK